MIPTDSGICCAFNAENTLRETSYSELVKEMQDIDKRDRGFPFMNKQKAIVGKENGLKLFLDSHSNQVSFGTIASNFKGFQVFLGTPTEFPSLRERSYKLLPGHGNVVEVTAYRITAEDQVKNLHPSKRKCYYPCLLYTSDAADE